MKKTRKGFTLVELLVVIAILAILSTITVVGFTTYIKNAEEQAAKSEAAAIEDAIETALVLDNTAHIKLSDTSYIIFKRDGLSYKVMSGTAPAGALISGIDSALAERLQYVADGGLKYVSAKGVEIVLKAHVEPTCEHEESKLTPFSVTAPTCELPGYTTYTCSCGNYSTTGDSVPALGHKGGTATCTKKAVCTTCGSEHGDLAPHTYVDGECTATDCDAVDPDYIAPTHEIYFVGNFNNWGGDGYALEYKLTENADGTWTGTLDIDDYVELKLFNTAKGRTGDGWINSAYPTDGNNNVELNPGKYTFVYSVANNTFTYTMESRYLYVSGYNGTYLAVWSWHRDNNVDTGSQFTSATKMADGNYWKVAIPENHNYVMFCSMKSATNDWSNVDRKTVDLAVMEDKNVLYHVGYGAWSELDKTPTTMTIYFDNSTKNWNKVNSYKWGGNANKDGWPGVLMTKYKDTNVWYCTVTIGDYANIIFNDGNTQTGDLTIPKGKNYYNGSSWSVELPLKHNNNN